MQVTKQIENEGILSINSALLTQVMHYYFARGPPLRKEVGRGMPPPHRFYRPCRYLDLAVFAHCILKIYAIKFVVMQR